METYEDNCNLTLNNNIIVQDLTEEETVLFCQYVEGEIDLCPRISEIIEKVQQGAAGLDKDDVIEKLDKINSGDPEPTYEETVAIIKVQEGIADDIDPKVLDAAFNKLAGDNQFLPLAERNADTSDDDTDDDSSDESHNDPDELTQGEANALISIQEGRGKVDPVALDIALDKITGDNQMQPATEYSADASDDDTESEDPAPAVEKNVQADVAAPQHAPSKGWKKLFEYASNLFTWSKK